MQFWQRLFDFGKLTGGRLSDKRNIESEKMQGCYGKYDPIFVQAGMSFEC